MHKQTNAIVNPIDHGSSWIIDRNQDSERLSQDRDTPIDCDLLPKKSDNANVSNSGLAHKDERIRSSTNFIEPVLVAAETQNFANNLAGETTSVQVTLNDLHDTDIESISSTDTWEESAPSFSKVIGDKVTGVPYCPAKETI